MIVMVFDVVSDGIPTSVDFVRDDPTRMVTSYTSAACLLFDLETGQAVTRLDTDQVMKPFTTHIITRAIFCRNFNYSGQYFQFRGEKIVV